MLKELLNKEMELRSVEASNLNIFLKEYFNSVPSNNFASIDSDIKTEDGVIKIDTSNPLFLNIVFPYTPLYKLKRILKNDKTRAELEERIRNTSNASLESLRILKEVLSNTYNKSIEIVLSMTENLLNNFKKEKGENNKLSELYKNIDTEVYEFKSKYPILVNKYMVTIGCIDDTKNNENNSYYKLVEAILEVIEIYDILLNTILSIIAEFGSSTSNKKEINYQSHESQFSQPITKENLIEDLNKFSVSKQDYNESQTNNIDKNKLLLNKGFPSKYKDKIYIYQRIQKLIARIKGKGDYKAATKINDFFSEQHIPFKIISEQMTSGKQTYWLILKLE